MSDKTGQKFGRLTIVERVESYINDGAYIRQYRCKCDCGNDTVVMWHNLQAGRTKSCGCLRREKMKERRMKNASPKI